MKRFKGYAFRAGVEAFATKATKALGLTDVNIVWSRGISTAGIDNHGTLYLSDVDDASTLTETDLHKYCGFVLHELCHHAYTDFHVRGSTDYVRTLHNAVEDAWIEHRAIDRALMGNVAQVFEVLIAGMVTEALAAVTDWADPRQYPFALAVYLRKHAARKVPLANGLEPIFREAGLRLENAQSSVDTLAIAEWVMSQLKALQPEEKPNEPTKPTDRPKQGPKGDAGDDAGDAGDAEGDAGDDAGDDAGNPGDPGQGGKPAGDATAPADDCTPTHVEPSIEGNSVTISWYERTAIVEPAKCLEAKWQEIKTTVPGRLRYNLRRLFDNSDRTDFQMGRKYGSVNTSALPTYQHNANVFKLRREIDGIDSAVVICLDVSSSMYRDESNRRRIRLASECTAALLETLKHAQVATSMIAYGSRVSVIKRWTDGLPVARDRLSKIATQGSTDTFSAMRHAHELLMHRTEARKVCIVITDGECNAPHDSKHQVQVGKALGITTIGIGISLDVSRVFPEHINVQDVKDLAEATFKNIKLAA
jgi:hypothetical protein